MKNPQEQDYTKLHDPTRVVGPVMELVCPALLNAWTINKSNSMAFIFDVVNPVRKFKRRVEFDEEIESPYAEYESDAGYDSDVTETDVDATTQPYNPIPHK